MAPGLTRPKIRPKGLNGLEDSSSHILQHKEKLTISYKEWLSPITGVYKQRNFMWPLNDSFRMFQAKIKENQCIDKSS